MSSGCCLPVSNTIFYYKDCLRHSHQYSLKKKQYRHQTLQKKTKKKIGSPPNEVFFHRNVQLLVDPGWPDILRCRFMTGGSP